MKKTKTHLVVLVTAPDQKTARQLSAALLEAKTVACVNLVPGLESHFWWQGKVQKAREVLLMCKTTAGKVAELEQLVLALHPYDLPEIIALPVSSGTAGFLDWWTDVTK
jgi:periplasmic divalent cation tolerance protein